VGSEAESDVTTDEFPKVTTARKPAPDESKIECGVHGSAQEAFACEHLVADPKQKWFSDEPTEGNLCPDAWCLRCEEVYLEQGEWNDENSSRLKIKLLCHRCYELLRNQRVDS